MVIHLGLMLPPSACGLPSPTDGRSALHRERCRMGRLALLRVEIAAFHVIPPCGGTTRLCGSPCIQSTDAGSCLRRRSDPTTRACRVPRGYRGTLPRELGLSSPRLRRGATIRRLFGRRFTYQRQLVLYLNITYGRSSFCRLASQAIGEAVLGPRDVLDAPRGEPLGEGEC